MVSHSVYIIFQDGLYNFSRRKSDEVSPDLYFQIECKSDGTPSSLYNLSQGVECTVGFCNIRLRV